jgi:flagellar FliL protein
VLQNKLFQWLIIVLISITLIALAGFVLWDYMERNNQSSDPAQQAQDAVAGVKPKPLSASEQKELTVPINDITTNLAEKNQFVKVSFAFLLDGKKAKEEFEQLDFKVKDTILRTLADLKAEQIQGNQGYDLLTSTLMNKLNSMLTQGKVAQVFITYINIAGQ